MTNETNETNELLIEIRNLLRYLVRCQPGFPLAYPHEHFTTVSEFEAKIERRLDLIAETGGLPEIEIDP